MYNLYIVTTPQTLARTQIYLTHAQQKRLAQACRRADVTKSELIRQAVDQFLDLRMSDGRSDQTQRLNALAGMWAQREDMVDPAGYVRELRAPRF
jgi:hypothetical protein